MRRTSRKLGGLPGPHDGAVAAPEPVTRIAAEAGLERVARDIANRRPEVVVVPNFAGAKARTEDMAVTFQQLVVALRVDAIQELHAEREVGLRCVHDEVVVGSHQDVRPADPLETPDDASHEIEEEHATVVVDEEVSLVDRSRRDVVDAGDGRAQLPHAPTLDAASNERASPRNSSRFRYTFEPELQAPRLNVRRMCAAIATRYVTEPATSTG